MKVFHALVRNDVNKRNKVVNLKEHKKISGKCIRIFKRIFSCERSNLTKQVVV
jgi:hypothetical protein